MPKYNWNGYDKNKKKVDGVIQAKSLSEAKLVVRRLGYIPTRVSEPGILDFDLGEWLVEKGFASSVDHKDLMKFTRKLSILINAGVPILEALEMLSKQEEKAVFKAIIKKVCDAVSEGKTFAEALASQKGFDALYCNLVKAGETGGILDTILGKIAEHLEKQEKIKAQVKGALTYPTIVTLVGIVVVALLMIFVVPQFVDMLKDTGQELPLITKIVIDISNFMQSYTLLMLPVIGGGFMAFINFIKTPQGKQVWDRFIMRVPIFGDLVIKANLNSFTRTLSTMLTSGVSLIDSLEICIDTIDNVVVKRDIKRVRAAVINGKSMTEPMMRISYFPPLVTQMMKVGESTGNMDNMLLKVANVFEEEVGELIGTATKLIEPLILVVLGGIIAGVLVAMYLPMFMSAGGNGP